MVRRFVTTRPEVEDPALLGLLEEQGVTVEAESTGGSWWARALVSVLPWVLVLGLFFYLSYRMQKKMMGGGGDGGPFSFTKSKAKRYRESNIRTTLEDVAGVE